MWTKKLNKVHKQDKEKYLHGKKIMHHKQILIILIQILFW